ncbi:hypothetical protein POTOM_001341 [Populus tomentosa]|uniref:Uncharacterized protein n=1 Tax=Populus tomentosa TaxID=118781 RepID=A0A8X8IXY7_POPTO|nr:hypothetical protein POTOM_001341 [Populus tomentosa]
MAVTCLSSPHILVHKSGPVIKPVSRILMLQRNSSHVPLKKAPTLPVRSSLKAKLVFENRAEGIVCYRDESGEIICEGFDEGPRFHQQLQCSSYHPRFDYSQPRMLRSSIFFNKDCFRLSMAVSLTALKMEDCNRNGFNKFY